MGKKIHKLECYVEDSTKNQLLELLKHYQNSAVFVGVELKKSDILRFCINYTYNAILK